MYDSSRPLQFIGQLWWRLHKKSIINRARPSIRSTSMAATGPAFGQAPLLNNSFWKSLSTKLDRQPWKSVGAASALTLGLSLTVISKAPPVAAEEKNAAASLQKVIMAGLMDTRWPSSSNYDTLFASLSLGPGEDWVEPKTGVVFPGVSLDGKRLTGIGLRKKRVLGLKNIIVYAYGLYADPDSLKSTLSTKYDSFTPADLSNKEVLFADVTKSDVGLTVRLVIVYGKLKIGSIRSAFEESVGKGLKKFSGDDNTELLKRFTSIFTDDVKLPKGTCIDISRLPDHVLHTKIDGQEMGSVQSSLLCQALFDLYIGEDAFDKPAREAMSQSFESILSGQW